MNRGIGAVTKLTVITALLALVGPPAQGTIIKGPDFGFDCITNNSGSCSTDVAPLFLLTLYEDDAVTGRVLFKFQNLGPAPSTITSLYWDDHPMGLLSDMQIGATYGLVSFGIGGNPYSPPGGNDLLPSWGHDDTSFVATRTRIDSVTGGHGVGNGIDPDEYQFIQFSVRTDLTAFGDATPLDVLTAALVFGDLRVAIHVQAIGQADFSESLILIPVAHDVPDVPEPRSVLLLLVGIAILLVTKGRRL